MHLVKSTRSSTSYIRKALQSILLRFMLSYRSVLPEWDKNVLACVVSSKIQSLPLFPSF